MSIKLSEIQTKLQTATPEQLNAILEILNTKPAPVVPKKRATNAWVEYLSAYKIKHPDEPHKIAMANALTLYKKPVVAVVEKKVKTPKVIECHICAFQPANKSNLNRHMKTAHTREKTMLTIAKVKGLEKRYTKRMESKNPDVKAEAIEKIKEAEMLKARVVKALALLTPGQKISADIQTKKKEISKKPKSATLPKTLLDDINKIYQADNNIDLNITQHNVKSVSKLDDTYTINTTNLMNLEECERIDQIIVTKQELGYDVCFLQEIKMKNGDKKMSEIDSIFIYE